MSKITILSNREKHYGTYRCVQKIFLDGEFLGDLDFERNRSAFYCSSEVYGFFRGKTIAELKRNILKEVSDRKPCAKKRKETPCKYLPAADNADFYPTPAALAGLMFSYVKWDKVFTVLEPSAGKGDLYDCLARYNDNKRQNVNMDCIERDANLRLILKGKGLRVVHDDFLTFRTQKKYDAIVMNPPFSAADKHLLKAIEMQERGGQIVCLLNAETLRNPYTLSRKELVKQLKKYHATVRYIKDAFRRAERRTEVEIAVVYLNIPYETHSSSLYERMKKAEEVKTSQTKPAQTALALSDKVKALVSEYNVETAAVIELFGEYNALTPHITGNDKYNSPDVHLRIGGCDYEYVSSEAVNDYLRAARYRYWRALLDLPGIRENMTRKIESEFQDRLQDLRDYDFSEFNVNEVFWEIKAQLYTGVESEIEALFDELSAQHSFYDGSDNVHYYNGWTTNKACYINSKVILPFGVFGTTYKRDKYGRYKDVYKDCIDSHKAYGCLRDIEKVLDYLAGAGFDGAKTDLSNRLHFAEKRDETKNIDCTYFDVTFYKKGTAHIKFNSQGQKLIDKLNAYIGTKRQWLPPTYGKRRYADMTEREQEIVREFNGSPEAYDYVVDHADEYLLDVSTIPLLA